MPTVNIFYSDDKLVQRIEEITRQFKEYIADQLTCKDIKLKPDEISIRFLRSEGVGMLAPIELEITASAYEERVAKQDEICLNIQKFLISKLALYEVNVWLILAELGHSAE